MMMSAMKVMLWLVLKSLPLLATSIVIASCNAHGRSRNP
jgi:hypothetical protein